MVSLAWRLLGRLPWLQVALGAALLFLAISIAASFGDTNFRTEGSPAGMLLFAVMGSAVAVAAMLGLVLLAKGLMGVGRSGPVGPVGAVIGVVAAAFLFYFVHRFQGSVDAPKASRSGSAYRVFPPTSELASQRVAPVGETYELSWRARRDAKALQLRVPGAQIAPDPRARGPGVVETVDGPRSVELRLPDGAAMRLHRDDSTLDEATFDALHNGVVSGDAGPRLLWVDTGRRGWRLVGLDCPPGSTATPALPAAAGHPARCHSPPGVLARWLPSLFAPSRVPLASRVANGNCQWAFPYRQRAVTVDRAGACFTSEGLAALGAAADLLERMERDTKAVAR